MNELSTPRRSAKRRLVLGGGLGSAVAGMAAVAIVVSGGGTGAPAPSGTEPLRLVNAAQLLNKASEAAAAEPDLKPKPGQYLYFFSKSHQASTTLAADPAPIRQGAVDTVRHVWLSASGAKPGYLEQDESGRVMKSWLCDVKQSQEEELKEQKKQPDADPARPPSGCTDYGPTYRTDIPTDAAAAKRWLYRNSNGGNPPDVQAFHTVGDTIREHYLGSKSLAALFKAAADIPGVELHQNVLDFAGRKGVAVGQTFNGLRQELIFDPATYKLLGERQIYDFTDPSTPHPQGTESGDILYSNAYLAFKIVNTPGQK
ncbi:hypothetical protein GCM10027589_45090 [Actinocorallia lasiicapitis]